MGCLQKNKQITMLYMLDVQKNEIWKDFYKIQEAV